MRYKSFMTRNIVADNIQYYTFLLHPGIIDFHMMTLTPEASIYDMDK